MISSSSGSTGARNESMHRQGTEGRKAIYDWWKRRRAAGKWTKDGENVTTAMSVSCAQTIVLAACKKYLCSTYPQALQRAG